LSEPLLEVANLHVSIPLAEGVLHAVRGIDLSLERAQTLGIVGESGSGKSLTALALMRLLPSRARLSAERLALSGLDLTVLSEARLAREVRGSRLAMIFQEPMTSLNPVYTIGRQLTETMRLHGECTQEEATERAVRLLERVGIAGAARRLGQYPHQFSGGQRQRVMIAMALMNDPELLIADEPTTALDVTVQAQILRLLADLQQEFGMALILITHNLGMVARVADRVAVMYAGQFVEWGPTDSIFRAPMHPYTHGLLASLPPDGPSEPGTRLGSIRGIVPSLVGEIRGCAFAQRCDHARHECLDSAPPLRMLELGQTYRCVLTPADERVSASPSERAAAAQRSRHERSGAALLSAENVSVSFAVKRGLFGAPRQLRAVDDVTLEIRRGDILALVGESGSGKTTLARLLLGLLPPQRGSVRLEGMDVATLRARDVARRVQPIFQDPYSSLNPRRTLAEIIRRPLEIHGIGTSAERRDKVARMMARVGLPARLQHNYPNQLSGGQRQRVAIARAIIMEPQLVICDEPTSALDVSVQAQILNLLLDLRETLGLTYLIITHDLAVVRQMATRVAVMYLGEIVETGEASDLFGTPRHPYTQALLASALTVTPGAGIPDNRIGSSFPNALELPTGCRFHPRCPAALPICAQTPAPIIGEHAAFVRCHLHASAASRAA
jgi:peptide/nickel transport system ATP-binding protein